MRPQVRFVSIALFALLLVSVSLVGCSEPAAEEPALEPTVAPPVIGEAGVLRVGVDLDYPPFAGTDKGREAGIDIDVAAAIASELQLTLETVQVAPSEAATALADGTVDMVMSVPFSDEAMVGSALAGSYIADGPAFFSSAETTETLALDSVRGRAIGAQEGSSAYWVLVHELGTDAVASYPTLRAAFEAAQAGDIEVVGCDAIIGAYIAQDFDSVRFAGQMEPATSLGVAVSAEASELEGVVRDTLDGLAADGILETIRTKWVGSLPELDTSSTGTVAP